MPLSDEQKRLLDAARTDIEATELDSSLNAAVRRNPDQSAKVVELAEWGQLPRDTVERNLPEVDARHHREQIPDAATLNRDYPATAEYLKDADNAAVSIDDVDTLTGLEHVMHYEPWSATFGRGFVSRINELVGNLMQAGGTIADDIGSGPGITIGDDGISWHWETPDNVPSALTVMGKYVSEGEAHRVGYVPRFTWEKFKGEMTPTNLAGYILETGVKSLPDMVATLGTLPAYVTSRSQEIAEARVENDGRSDVDTSDLAKSLPTAVLVSLLERIGSMAVFGHGSVNTFRDVAGAAGGAFVKEGATEFVQEGAEYYGETIGTRRDVRHEEALDRALAGLVAGGPFGGGIRAGTATGELIANKTMKDSVIVGESMQEQQTLDQIIELAQRSKTNERAQDRFASFLRGAGAGRGVYVPSSVISELGDAAPEYLTRQAEQQPDGDVFIPMDRLGAEIVPDEQLLEAIRPHARLSPRSLSAQELAEGNDATVQALVEAATAEQDLKTEADAIYEQVKDQLVATGRQSDATAKYSAALYPAMATRLAVEHDITPRQAFEAMGFEIVGPDGLGTGDVELNQLGMFSAVDRAVAQLKMPEWKNEGGKVRGDQIWQKLQPGKAAGVRAEEIEWLGLQEFLTPYADAGISRQTHEVQEIDGEWTVVDQEGTPVGPTFDTPKAANKFIKSGGQLQFTREQVQEFVQSNGVTIDETIAEEQEIEDEMEWDEADVWDDPEAWTNEVDDIHMVEYDAGEETIFGFDPESDWLLKDDNFETFASDHDGGDMEQEIIDDEDVDALREYFERININFDEALRQAAREKAEEAATEFAHDQYMEDPYYTVYSPNTDLYLFGNDEIGWDIRDGSTDWRNSVIPGNSIESMAEAQIQALEWAINNGRLESEESESVARWRDYINEDEPAPAENYREIKIKLPNIEGDFYNTAHFTDRNIVAFLRVSDRDDMFFIDELQSDWHSEGRRSGYKTGEDTDALEARGVEINAQIVEHYKAILGNYNTDEDGNFVLPISEELGGGTHPIDLADAYLKFDLVMNKQDGIPIYHSLPIITEAILNDVITSYPQIEELKSLRSEYQTVKARQAAEVQGTTNAPFKGDGWLNLGLKRGLLMAAREGKSQFGWVNNAELQDRWSDSNDYAAQYDQKMVSMVRKLTGQTPVQYDNDGVALGDRRTELIEQAKGRLDKPGSAWEVTDYNAFLVMQDDGSFQFDNLTDDTAYNSVEEAIDSLSFGMPPGYWSIELTPEVREQILGESFALYQNTERKRGSFYPEERIIQLQQASDLSTFLHESAHLFLEVERQFAQQYGVSDNHQAILEFLDAESFDDLNVNTPEGVERHEKFARAFEAYLREGKAPSLRLRDAFAAFKRWLLQIYREIAGLDVELTDGIRQAFDRMLATDTEIAEAMSNPAYDQYFQSIEQAGMSDEEWDKYQKLVEHRRTKADETVTEKALRQLRERREKDWKEEREPLIEEETERLRKLPVYSVMADLAASPMDYDATLQAMGGEISNRLRGKLIGRAVRTEGAVDPELYAEAYGFDGVADMLTQIEGSPGLKEAATDAAQQRMIEMHGDILNDGTLEAEVEEAIHNDEQAELLLMELKALRPRGGVPINREYLRAEARRMIGSMKFSEIQPGKFYRAEIRAAKRSVTDPNPYDAKVQQLINHYLYREAVETKAAMTKQRSYVRQVRNRKYDPKTVDREYIANMQSLATLYDMTDKGHQQAALDSILNWYVTQTTSEEVLVDLQLLDPHLIMALEARNDGQLANIALPKFDDMTAEDVRGVYEMLRHMRFVGGQMADRQALEVAAERRAITDSVIDNGGRDKRVPGELGRKEWSALKISKYLFNKLISLRNMTRTLDNTFESEELGVFERLIYQRIEGASNDRIEIANDIHDRYKDALADVHRVGLSKRRIDPVLLDNGETVTPTEEEVFMMAMYWGIESSREAIRQGHGFSDPDVMRIISNLSVDQLNIVNAVWAVNESVWPQLSGAAIRRYGVAPEKLDAAPFMVNGVHMTGGHMRLFYDSSDIELEEERQLGEDFATMMPTKAGSLHARVGSGGRPVALDKNNIIRAMEENIHFIAFAEVGSEVRRLMNGRDVQAAIERKHGREFKRALVEQIDNLLRAKPDPESGISKHIGVGFRLLRRAATYRHLVFSVRNVMQQFSALPIVVSEVGPVRLIESMARLTVNRGELLTEIQNLSPFMRNRTSFVNREATEYLKTVTVESGARYVVDEIMKYGFAPQTFIDALLAYPAWMAKYEQQMQEHGDVRKAVSQADTAVAETVGSGADIHLGGAFASTNSEFVKTLTVFGTWFNAYYQRMYRDTNGWTKARPASLNTLVLMPILAGSMAAVLVMDFPDDDSDEEWWQWFLRQYALFLGATVPGIRDLASAMISGFPPKTPFAGGIEALARGPGEIEAMMEGRQSGLKTASDLTKVVTSIVPVPGSGEVTRVADFVDSFMQGREGSDLTPDKIYQALVEGPDRND